MSRHRKAYDEDDLIDYDDEDYDYDDYDYRPPPPKPAAKAVATTAKGKPAAPSQKAGAKGASPAASTPAAKAQPTVVVAKSSGLSLVATKAGGSATSAGEAIAIKSVSSAPTIPVDGQLVNDVTLMGFAKEARSMVTDPTLPPPPRPSAAGAVPPAVLPQISLHAGTIVSDDEVDAVEGHFSSMALNPARKPHVTVVVAGHVDAGKSTLVGNLLRLRGEVSQKTIRKYEKQSQDIGKGSYALAWVMDDSTSEREHGVTINVSEKQFQTDHRDITILDAPGHKDFIPNLIAGAAQANAALLVVPAAMGEFESSMSAHAQTREHALLLRALGINQIILVVNKMDVASPPWHQSRFLEIESQVKDLLRNLQVNVQNVVAIPVSGLRGGNLVTRPDHEPDFSSTSNSAISRAWDWYIGPTLLEALDGLHVPEHPMRGSLRAIVTASPSQSEILQRRCDLNVTVLRGRIRVGRSIGIPHQHQGMGEHQVLFSGSSSIDGSSAAPRSDTSTSRSSSDGSGTSPTPAAAVVVKICNSVGINVPFLVAGESGVVSVEAKAGKNCSNLGLRQWSVIYKGPQVLHAAYTFRATILTTSSLPVPIIPGTSFELYLFGQEIECSVSSLISSKNSSGTRQRPKCISANSCALVDISVRSPVCIEPFRAFKPFGRFAMRAKGVTCAIGTCDHVL